MKFTKFLFSLYFVLLTVVSFSGLHAKQKATTSKEILTNLDKALSPGKDMAAIMDMTLIDKDGTKNKRVMKFYRKTITFGEEKKIFTFCKPANVRGVTFLSLSDDEMYTYMPAFKKIRRIASHVKNEKFMGTDMSYNDMSETSYVKKYTPEPKYEDKEDFYILTLKRKPGADTDYTKLIVTLRKDNFIRTNVEMYKNSRLAKIMKQEDIKKINNYWSPGTISMEDMKTNHKTIMKMKDITYDSGLEDKMFSQRKIKRIKCK